MDGNVDLEVDVGAVGVDGVRFVGVDVVVLGGVGEAGGVDEAGLVGVDEVELVGFDGGELDVVGWVERAAVLSPR
ncbi:MAG TPA: hypothetical protein VK605_06580 [Solirubrobacteraceae bacterium]|nr:hypothetical protein [Solirubrobacteraceae bacterium]